MSPSLPSDVVAGLAAGTVVPYLGPAVLDLAPGGAPVPSTPERLAAALTGKVTVPHRIRNRLTAAAQFIENFKHRKTLVAHMKEAFAPPVAPTPLHACLAALPLPLIVTAWYDGALAAALAGRPDWGQVQGLSHAERPGAWFGYYDAQGRACEPHDALAWRTLVYQPMGSIAPAANFLVSDSDYVEVLTEIDIQTPIPERVQQLRAGRSFLFLGCRFNDQLARVFARQVMKRSSDRHWAVLHEPPTRNEARFLEELGIERIELPLERFCRGLAGAALAVPA